MNMKGLKMKSIIFICVFLAVVVGFCVYIEINTRQFVGNLPQVLTSKEQPQSNTIQSASEVDKPVPSYQSEQITAVPEQDPLGFNDEKTEIFDWTKDDSSRDWRVKSSDPFSDFLAEQQAKERGTLIVEGMSAEELWNAELNQMIEQFGDIPAVHTVMKYTRMFNNDIQMTFDENIEWLEAIVQLYPTATNKRTLAFDKWRYSRGKYPADMGEITPRDIAELRSMGITVKQEITANGVKLTISTE